MALKELKLIKIRIISQEIKFIVILKTVITNMKMSHNNLKNVMIKNNFLKIIPHPQGMD